MSYAGIPWLNDAQPAVAPFELGQDIGEGTVTVNAWVHENNEDHRVVALDFRYIGKSERQRLVQDSCWTILQTSRKLS